MPEMSQVFGMWVIQEQSFNSSNPHSMLTVFKDANTGLAELRLCVPDTHFKFGDAACYWINNIHASVVGDPYFSGIVTAKTTDHIVVDCFRRSISIKVFKFVFFSIIQA